jgi:transposase
VTGPDGLRARFGRHTVAALVAETASRRPRPGSTVGSATRIALRGLGRRAQFPGGQLERPGELIVPLVTARAPGLLAPYGVGPDTAALLLIAAGDHPAAAVRGGLGASVRRGPVPASPGTRTRRRRCPGGDRQANHALRRIVITRMGSHPPDPRLRRAAHRRGPAGDRDHPLPQALCRPRDLPPPARRR